MPAGSIHPAHQRNIIRLVAVVILLSMVTGCGPAKPAATAVQATATHIALQATNSPLPPTATLASATVPDTPIPPTETATLPPARTYTPTSTPLPTSTPTPLSPLTGSGGGVIAFTSARDGNLEIYVMNADGSDPRRMTNQPGEDYWPTWSPDGYAYDDYYALMEGLPSQIVAHYKPSLVTELCATWPVEPAAAIENEPVVSDVPALVLSGEIDPITPPRWAQQAAQRLSKGFYYVFPGYGHGVTRKSECALAMMLQFLDDPSQEPDASCIGEPRR